MLIRSTWTLTVDAFTTLPKTYQLALSKQLHAQAGLDFGNESIPSVTYSGISGRDSSVEDFITFSPDEFYTLSLNGLNEPASKAIEALDLSEHLEFLGARFKVINREDEATSYEALYHRFVADEPEPVRRLAFSFSTPTAFSQHRTYLPLPVPTLMFHSWLERWNHFSPVYLGADELIEYFGGSIALSRHRIQTRSYSLDRGFVTGFTGTVNLKVLRHSDPLLANVAELLANYAQFVGTGIKTRLGMGETVLNTERNLSNLKQDL
ncbi:MAG: CRISPR-associated protein Cas6 [Phormidesmis priestleyi]|uniref:CRISPR-associated protein Cas6 n=1 Tax=Phormidesmis priestleyi TaxID=268141 RepID=A0A2W4XQL4_9CYAN|nr:MAG: CRISPR-associated protein Cas6 [Phormidesmis priestleyi]